MSSMYRHNLCPQIYKAIGRLIIILYLAASNTTLIDHAQTPTMKN